MSGIILLKYVMLHYREKISSFPDVKATDLQQIYKELAQSWDDIVLQTGLSLYQINFTGNEMEFSESNPNAQDATTSIERVRKQFQLVPNQSPFVTKTLKEKILCWCFFYDMSNVNSLNLVYPTGDLIFQPQIIKDIFSISGKGWEVFI
jgi:hypothetical protein